MGGSLTGLGRGRGGEGGGRGGGFQLKKETFCALSSPDFLMGRRKC